MNIDSAVLYFFYAVAGIHWSLDWLIVFFAKYSPYAMLLVAAWVILGEKGRKRQLQLFFVAALSALLSRAIITECISFFYSRSRPFAALQLEPLFSSESAHSFPSGHASFYAAVALAIYLYNRRAGAWLISLTLIMGLARIAAGIHWPSDIFAGFIVGVASVFAVHWFLGDESAAQRDSKTEASAGIES